MSLIKNHVEIENISNEIFCLKKKITSNLITVGKKLFEAKSLLNHGEFEVWLKDKKVNMSKRTAQRFMELFKYYGHLLDAPGENRDILTLGCTQLLAFKSLSANYYKVNKLGINGKIYTEKSIDEDKLREFLNQKIIIKNKTLYVKNLSGKQAKEFIKKQKGEGVCSSESKHFWSYISGLMDGEGCILIIHKGGTEFEFIITISNTVPKPLYKLKQALGFGEVYKTKRTNFRDIYNFKLINPFQILQFVNKLDLMIKENQLKIMKYAIDLYLKNKDKNYKDIALSSVAIDYYNKGMKYYKLNEKSKQLMITIKQQIKE